MREKIEQTLINLTHKYQGVSEYEKREILDQINNYVQNIPITERNNLIGPFLLASRIELTDIALIYLESEMSIDIKDKNLGFTPLQIAVEKENLNLTRAVLDLKPKNLNIQDEYGNTPLHMALMNGSYAIAADLINAGATLDVENFDGKKPLEIMKPFNEKLGGIKKIEFDKLQMILNKKGMLSNISNNKPNHSTIKLETNPSEIITKAAIKVSPPKDANELERMLERVNLKKKIEEIVKEAALLKLTPKTADRSKANDAKTLSHS